MSTMVPPLAAVLATLPDFRADRGKRHPLTALLLSKPYEWANEERLVAVPTDGPHPSQDSSDKTRALGWQA